MNISKQPIQTIKFNLAIGEARPGPHLAPILGQAQVNIQTFCVQFNELTSQITDGIVLPVKVEKYADKSFKVFYKTPTVNYIFEQLVMSRDTRYISNFNVITEYELIDMLNILNFFAAKTGLQQKSDRDCMKQILSFLGTKLVRILKS